MRVNAVFRIALSMVGVVIAVLLGAFSLGLFPDARHERLNARKLICENVAVQCCLAAQRNDTAMMQAVLSAMKTRNEDVLSVGLRRDDGRVVASAGEHEAAWRAELTDSASKAEVPIRSGKKAWG